MPSLLPLCGRERRSAVGSTSVARPCQPALNGQRRLPLSFQAGVCVGIGCNVDFGVSGPDRLDLERDVRFHGEGIIYVAEVVHTHMWKSGFLTDDVKAVGYAIRKVRPLAR